LKTRTLSQSGYRCIETGDNQISFGSFLSPDAVEVVSATLKISTGGSGSSADYLVDGNLKATCTPPGDGFSCATIQSIPTCWEGDVTEEASDDTMTILTSGSSGVLFAIAELTWTEAYIDVESGSTPWVTGTGSISYDGNAGIGTTMPNRRLHVYQTSGNNAEINIQSVIGSNEHWAIYQDRASEDLRFWNDDAVGEQNILTITNEGKVGIGTLTPNKFLHVYSGAGDNAEIDIQSVAGTDKHWAIYQDRTTEDLNFWHEDGDNVLTVTNEGLVGIGTTTVDSGLALDVDGKIGADEYCNADGTICKNFAVDALDHYFLLSHGTWTGNLGGNAGADAKCLQEVNDYDWLGKNDRLFSEAEVHAFICGGPCFNLAGNTEYTFGVINDMAHGGNTFITDEYGRGPNNTDNWSLAGIFGGSASYWAARGDVSNNLWSNSNSGDTCSNWTNGWAGNTSPRGDYGASGYTDSYRWNRPDGYNFCKNTRHIICAVDGTGSPIDSFCDVNPDRDSDGYNAIVCGGDDCLDDPDVSDAAHLAHPNGVGPAEQDLMDNDCDGTVDESGITFFPGWNLKSGKLLYPDDLSVQQWCIEQGFSEFYQYSGPFMYDIEAYRWDGYSWILMGGRGNPDQNYATKDIYCGIDNYD